MKPQVLMEKVRCAECGTRMEVLEGIGAPGVFPVKAISELLSKGGKEYFRCRACERAYCWSCSDAEKTCTCGEHTWQERFYFPLDPDPPFLIDETGEANLPWERTLHFTPQQAGLPTDIAPRELNRYLRERVRKESRKIWGILDLFACGFGVLLWLTLAKFFVPILWRVVVTVCGTLVAILTIGRMYALLVDVDRGFLIFCPHCRTKIIITSTSPSSAWLCNQCGFNHFKFWRARKIGPSEQISDVGDVATRNRKANELAKRAVQLKHRNRFQEAKRLLEEAIALWPNEPSLYDELSACLSRLGDLDAALQASSHAIELDPNVPRFYTNRGMRLLRAGRLEKAVECAQKALNLDPDFKSAHKLLQMVEAAERDRLSQA